MTWSIFAALVLTLPVIFFLFQIVVRLPLAALPVCGYQISAPSPMGFSILVAIHLMVYLPVLWGLSRVVSRIILLIPHVAGQRIAFAASIGALVVLAVISPYDIGGHGSITSASWVGAFTNLCRG
jgi:hypothetical protein